MKYGIYVGRFQPFHNGHKKCIEQGLKTCDKILILIGSSCQSQTKENPFTYAERRNFIENSLKTNDIIIIPLKDFPEKDDIWKNTVKQFINKYTRKEDKIYLLGFNKDNTSFYLNMFPEFNNLPIKPFYHLETGEILSSTDIRKEFFQRRMINFGNVPYKVACFLLSFYRKDAYKRIHNLQSDPYLNKGDRK